MKAILEAIQDDEHSSLAVQIYEKESFDTPWHFHPQYEIVYILEGQGTRYVGNSVEEFKEGDFVILAKNLPHCWKEAEYFTGQCRSVVIQWLDGILLTIPEFKPVVSFLDLAHQGIKFSERLSEVYADKVKGVVKEDPLDRYLAFVSLLSDLKDEKDFRLLCTDRHEYKLDNTASERLNKVYQYVEEHYHEKVNLQQVADNVNMSTESFSRFFSKSMNKSFFTFLNEYRINKACKILIETNEPVTSVCFACGFESLPFFHKQFKKVKNTTPLKYRKIFLASL